MVVTGTAWTRVAVGVGQVGVVDDDAAVTSAEPSGARRSARGLRRLRASAPRGDALAWAHLTTRSLTRYADAARDLGSEHWMPVVALAESALRAHRPDVAAAVFDAADQPGAHRAYLRRRRRELLDAPAAPNLRIVDGG